MLKLPIFILLGTLIPGWAISQGLVNNGATIVITNGSNVYINGTTGHYTNQSGGLITNNASGGTITLGGNWTNNAANTAFSNSGSTVVFNSASAQAIGGSNGTAFYNITASGNGTKTANTVSTISNLVSVGSNTNLNSNGNLTLLATATTNANVAPLLSGAVVSGNVNVQSYFTGGVASYRNTRAIASPINETGLSSKTYAQLKNYIIITGPGAASNGFDPGNTSQPNAVTLNRYNEPATLSQAQFTPVATLSEALSPGYGAFLYYRGDRSGYNSSTPNSSNKLVAPFATPENTTMQYTGPINQGDVVVTLSYTNNSGEDAYNGHNLIGNPYPAVIDWESVTKSVGVNNEVKIIKPGGGFATYINEEIANAGSYNPRYIQPGQGFYTRATANGATVTFTENCKAVSSAPARFLYNPKNEMLLTNSGFSTVPLRTSATASRLRMNLDDGINAEEALTVFKNGKSAIGNNEDALFFGGTTVSLSTLSSDNMKLTINFMPEISKVSELKLSVNATSTSNVKLNFTDLSAVQNSQVFLKDNLLGAMVDIKSNPTYSFNINKTVAASYGDNRLSLLFTPITTLPLSSVKFQAEKGPSGAILTWQNSSESEVAKYIIERVSVSSNFIALASIDANGKASYSFTDLNPEVGDNYYRLKLVDGNGNVTKSFLTSVNYTLTGAQLSVFPNPTFDKYSVDIKRSGNVRVVLYDMSGKEIRSKSFGKSETIQDNISALPGGVYVLHIIDESSDKIIGQTKLVRN